MKAKKVPRCVIFGAGGHSRVVIESILLTRSCKPIAIIDSNKNLKDTFLMGIKVVGDDTAIPDLVKDGATHFVVAIGSVGDPDVRIKISQLALKYGLIPLTVIHPSAIISKYAIVEEGVQILAGSIINAEAKISRFAIINSGAIIEHNCFIGNFVHIAPGAKLGGSVFVADKAHIGIGATIRERIKIGENAIIGAGSVVVSDVPSCKTFVGVPAKELKK